MNVMAEGWAAWSARIATEWTTALQDAVDDVVTYASSAVEASPVGEVKARVDAFIDAIWGDRGLFAVRDRVRAKELALARAGVDLDEVRARRAAELRGTDAEVAVPLELGSDFMTGRIDWYAMGFLKHTTPADKGNVGLAPLVVAGLVVTFVAACWAWVRSAEAANDARRWAWMDQALQAEIDGKQVDWKGIEGAAQAGSPPASSGSSSWLPAPGGGASLIGPAVVVGGVVVLALVLLGRR